jgi:hypothetical protein
MVDRKTEISDHFMHAGAGTSVALAWAGLIPGVFPFLALTVLVGTVLVLPFLAIGVVAAILAAPAYAGWRFIGWGRRRRRRREDVAGPMLEPAPFAGVC